MKCVCIKYNGVLLAPAPLISLSRTYQEVAGKHVGSTLTVKLDGKIVGGTQKDTQTEITNFIAQYPCFNNAVSPTPAFVVGLSASGVDNLLKEEDRVRQVFIATSGDLYTASSLAKNANLGVGGTSLITPGPQTNKFELNVNGTMIIEGYARVTSYSSSSENNYINTIDYSVELDIEEHKSLFNNNDTRYLISSYTDTITMEPIEDSNSFNIMDSVFTSYFGGNIANLNLDYVNNQSHKTRYNISRTIEAVGKHSNNVQNNPPQNNRTLGVGYGSAFSNARYYVLDRLKHLPTEIFMTNNYMTVNRSKVIESSESNGSFSIRETSLAINSSYHPPWIDDWTAEVSIDSTFLQTIRINGTIKGLETYGLNIREENASIMDGSQPGSWGVTQGGVGNFGGEHVIHAYNYSLPDYIPPIDQSFPVLPNPSTANTNTTTAAMVNLQQNNPVFTLPTVFNPPGELKIGKYQNAIQGMFWLKNSADIYASPIFQRAQLFGFSNNVQNHINNNYKWLNNLQYMNERMIGLTNQQIVPQINPIPVNITESHRKHVGEIDYSFEFNNRPLNLIPGSVSETLNINDTFPAQQIAEVFVLGRKLGPVLQNLGTVTSSTRDVTFEVVLPRPRALAQRFIFPAVQYQAITGVVEQLNPKYTFGTSTPAVNAIRSYVKTDNQSYDPLEGRIRIQKTWVWQRAV